MVDVVGGSDDNTQGVDGVGVEDGLVVFYHRGFYHPK